MRLFRVLIETVLLSTHTICFGWEIKTNTCPYQEALALALAYPSHKNEILIWDMYNHWITNHSAHRRIWREDRVSAPFLHCKVRSGYRFPQNTTSDPPLRRECTLWVQLFLGGGGRGGGSYDQLCKALKKRNDHAPFPNQTTDVHRGFILITQVKTWRLR